MHLLKWLFCALQRKLLREGVCESRDGNEPKVRSFLLCTCLSLTFYVLLKVVASGVMRNVPVLHRNWHEICSFVWTFLCFSLFSVHGIGFCTSAKSFIGSKKITHFQTPLLPRSVGRYICITDQSVIASPPRTI